uniref:Family with sequence similarity 180 member A n=1 Tax=Labrus bergylta TaxID=56723 RepID=A0A3Q3FJ60_9LABR
MCCVVLCVCIYVLCCVFVYMCCVVLCVCIYVLCCVVCLYICVVLCTFSYHIQQKNTCRISDQCLFVSCMQFLLGGVELDQDNNIILHDKELASMRPARAFLSQINDNYPRNLSSMMQMVATLEGRRRRPLTQDQFESLTLSMVYSAHRTRHQDRQEREAWGAVLLHLANVTVHELRGSRCPHLWSPQLEWWGEWGATPDR